MKFVSFIFVFLFIIGNVEAQEEKPEIQYAYNTFEGTRVVVGHSMEMLREGDMDFLIGHKFGRVNSGAYEFFGLDQAIIRIGFDYAVKDWLNIGVGRSSLDKLLDGFIKVQIVRQQSGGFTFPISIVALSTIAGTTLRAPDPNFPLLIQNRLSYTNQLLLGRQFGERYSIQLMPTHAHYNLVENRNLKNDIFSLGVATKVQLTKAIAFKAEYYYTFPGQLSENRTNSLAIGFDFDTGSHVFQTHLSNSGGLVESAFIGNTTGNWALGDIHLGFTISRVFRLKGRRY